MLTLSLIFFLSYFLIHFYVLTIGRFKAKQKKWNVTNTGKINLHNLTVIVPFRNELIRIEPLLNSIKESTQLPKKILFIDDHSNDGTKELIKEVLVGFPVSIVKLDADVFGKKEAIQFGVQKAETSCILTLDADTEFDALYFSNLTTLDKRELLILPVHFACTSFLSKLVHLDVVLLNDQNYGIQGVSKPIVASGANLLFDKMSFLKYFALKEHNKILSGDDMFLLQNFLKNKCSVQVIQSSDVSVRTKALKGFSPILQQRVRWIKKMQALKNFIAKSWGLYEVISQLFFVLLIGFSILIGNYAMGLSLFGLKVFLDCFFYLKTLFSLFRFKTIPLLIAYQFFFPFFVLLVGFSTLFASTTWKDRTL